MPKLPLTLPIFLTLAVLAAGCGSRPDGVTRQFLDRMAALDTNGMAQLVCPSEQAGFRESVDFLRVASDAAVELQDFKAQTQRSDGTSVVLSVSGRFVSAELGEMPLGGRVRLLRDGGEWCISGERDGFRAISGIAGDLFELLIRGGVSGDRPIGYPGGEWIAADVSTPHPLAQGSFELADGETIATGTGLQYREIDPGKGATPRRGQTLVVHYSLRLDYEVLDTTAGRGPFEFTLGDGEVIAGFEEGVATMREGGKRRLFVPPDLAYGEAGQGAIPPNSGLIFDVELLEIR